MLKIYRFILLIALSTMLIACGNSTSQLAEENTQNEHNLEKRSNIAEASAFDNAPNNTITHTDEKDPNRKHDVLMEVIANIHDLMHIEQAENDWFMLKEENSHIFKEERQRIKQPLSTFIADDYLDDAANDLLESYSCYCDDYFLFDEVDTYTNFKVTNYSEDAFEATTITLDDGFYGTGWTNEWTFVKENNRWKLADYTYIPADDRPLNITFEDIEDGFYDDAGKREETQFVKYLTINDVTHVVLERENGDYEIYNTETGVINFTAMEQYHDGE